MAEPGVLAFTKPSYVVKETGYRALLPVARTGGADGHVSVKWRTKDITAVNGKDFKGGEGELKFDNQETSKTIDITLFESNVSCIGLLLEVMVVVVDLSRLSELTTDL